MKIFQLHDLTRSLAGNLSDATQEQFEALIALRDEVLTELNQRSEISNDEKQILREISHFDKSLVHRMAAIRDEAADAIEKIQQSRIQKNAYEQGNAAASSYFIDKRK
ncbi:hypothetical protein AB6A23_02040 [Paenibacillus tarimensis]